MLIFAFLSVLFLPFINTPPAYADPGAPEVAGQMRSAARLALAPLPLTPVLPPQTTGPSPSTTLRSGQAIDVLPGTIAPPPSLFDFALPPFDNSATPTNVSFLNDAPAGAAGFVHAAGEHFVDGRGRVLRLWGVNFNFMGVFPTKEEAPQIAERLAKFGFNAVRLHHYEGYAAPNGIWSPAMIGSSRLKYPREFDATQLDRFDYFISELIKRGIYIDLNLHVARKSSEADGVPFAAALPEKDKGIDYYDERLIALQQEFSRQILSHVNPYTGRALKDEPGVCALEVDNESSLLAMWLDGSFKAPPPYEQDLRNRWNAWLAARYTPESLRAAWTESNDPLDPNNILDWPLPPLAPAVGPVGAPPADPQIPLALNSLARFSLATVSGAAGSIALDPTGGPSVDGFVRPGLKLSLDRLGTVPWSFQVNRDGLDLQENLPYTLSFWARADVTRRISVNLWQDRAPNRFEGFTGYADLTTDWQQFSFVLRAQSPDAHHSRLSWNLGNQTGAVQLGEIELHQGGTIAAPPQWTLANGVPLIDFKATPIWNARRDYAEFLGEIEAAQTSRMRLFLRTELGVRVPIWQTQAQFGGWGGIARESVSDANDVHAYWKHPDFGPQGWSGTNWKIENTSMAAAAPGTDPLSAFAFYHVPDKPLVMTEWNSGQPNDYGAESLLMAAAYGAWQDWAGIFIFDYHSSGSFERNKFEGFFSIDSQPVKMASAPTAALLFRRGNGDGKLPGDVEAAQDCAWLTLPRSWLWREVAGWPDGPSAAPLLRTWREAGGSRTISLQDKIYVRISEGQVPVATRTALTNSLKFASDSGQLQWDGKTNLFSLNAPRTRLLIGAMGGQGTQTLDELSVQMPATQSNWAAVALTTLDGAPVASSKSLLLTTLGKAENMNMGWNAEHNSVSNNWGDGPTQVEGIGLSVNVLTSLSRAQVWALDVNGAPALEVPATLNDGVLSFSTSARYKTLWYQIMGAREPR